MKPLTFMLIAGLGSLCVSCRTDRATVAELSMRFTHQELYTTRYDMPRLNALHEMKSRGLLRRGMAQEQVRRLLGLPDYSEVRDGSHQSTYHGPDYTHLSTEECNLPPGTFWTYHLKSSGLIVEFAPDGGRVKSFRWQFDEGGPPPLVW